MSGQVEGRGKFLSGSGHRPGGREESPAEFLSGGPFSAAQGRLLLICSNAGTAAAPLSRDLPGIILLTAGTDLL
jgi:hypothetical protein